MGVFNLCLLFITAKGECMQKKEEKNVGKIKLCSLGPYPNAYVSFLRNHSYRSSAHMFLLVVFFMKNVISSFCCSSTFGDSRVDAEVN